MTFVRRSLLFGFIAMTLLTLMVYPAPVRGQTLGIPAMGSVFALAATNSDGVRFDAAALQGNVSVVFFWSTGCAVCRDSLPELRANLAGWRNKPFMLVLVNVDRNAADWLGYERVLGKFQAPTKGYISVRQDDGGLLPTRLPMTLLVDTKGKILKRIEGRVAPEIWDDVADLL
jgi:thiol-disulfide isomerase/thioredoxin